jgi:hypothetical protein
MGSTACYRDIFTFFRYLNTIYVLLFARNLNSLEVILNALHYRQLTSHKHNAGNVKKFLQEQHAEIFISMCYCQSLGPLSLVSTTEELLERKEVAPV